MYVIMSNPANMSGAVSLPKQNYIESIADLVRERGRARTTDLAERLGISLPSVSEAVKRLVKLGFAVRKSRFEIGLTTKGRAIARQLEHRQNALRRFMVEVMAMRPHRADEMACRIEHFVDREFSDRLLELAEFMEHRHPRTLKRISDHLKKGKTIKGNERVKAA